MDVTNFEKVATQAELNVLQHYGLLKAARVHPEIKQFRKALTALQGGHAFHPSQNRSSGLDLAAILRTGQVRPSSPGGAVSFTSKPSPLGFHDSAYRGVIAPVEHLNQQGAVAAGTVRHPVSEAFGVNIDHIKTPQSYNLQRGDLVSVGPLDDPRLVRAAQKAYGVSPVSSTANYAAQLAQADRVPVGQLEERLRSPQRRGEIEAFLKSIT